MSNTGVSEVKSVFDIITKYEFNTSVTEVCNGVDDNCNGTTDEGTATSPQIGSSSKRGACWQHQAQHALP